MHHWVRFAVVAFTSIAAAVSAHASPTFSNPNFVAGQPASYPGYYNYNGSTDGWLSTNAAGSATGYASRNPSGLWDNGAAPDGVSGVAFMQNSGSQLSEMVGGFQVGLSYSITVAANGRSVNGANLPMLSIQVNGVEYGGAFLTPAAVTAVDPEGSFATPFRIYTSMAFTATSAMERIAFINGGAPGSQDVTIDLTNAAIREISTTSVPEPITIGLLTIGLLATLAGRRSITARASLSL